jgi:hypothetical protein
MNPTPPPTLTPAFRYRLLVAAIAVPTAWVFWITYHSMGRNGALDFVIAVTPVLASGIALVTCLASLRKPRSRHRKILLVTIPILMAIQLAWLSFYRANPPSTWSGTTLSRSDLAWYRRRLAELEASLATYAVCLYPLFVSRRWLPERNDEAPGGVARHAKPWSPRNPAFLLFLLLNLEILQTYVYLPYHVYAAFLGRYFYWLVSLLFFSALLWWRNASKFLKRIVALAGVSSGLFGAIAGLWESIQINYLLGALVAVLALTQGLSVIIFAVEIRAWRHLEGEASRVRSPR